MAVCVMVRLRTGRYDAARKDLYDVEWPPSPARLISALVASAGDEVRYDAVIQRLVDAPAPDIWASERYSHVDSGGYVVTNKVVPNKGTPERPGRTNQRRRRVSAAPDSAEFAFVWPDLDIDDTALGALTRLAWDIPYLGRSTSSAEVTVIAAEPRLRDEWVRWTSTTDMVNGSVVELPQGDYVAELRRQFDDGHAARAPRADRYYTVEKTAEEPTVNAAIHDGPYSDLAVLRLVDGPELAGEEVLRFAESLRSTVMSTLDDQLPLLVAGKVKGRIHVGYLPLPHVGYPHADGHLLGAAIAIPRDLDANDRRLLLSAITAEPVYVGDGRWQVELKYVPAGQTRPHGLRETRWTGGARGAIRWRTATPVMLDKYPQGDTTTADRITQSVTLAGYPEPVHVDIYSSPPMQGGIHRFRPYANPKRSRRPLVHCEIEFPEPVRGPVVAGALRYRGIGLFAPLPLVKEDQ